MSRSRSRRSCRVGGMAVPGTSGDTRGTRAASGWWRSALQQQQEQELVVAVGGQRSSARPSQGFDPLLCSAQST